MSGPCSWRSRTPDGQTISSVNYTVTNATGAVVVSDVLNVSSPCATASVEISLRAGAGYSIAMTATTSGGSSCTGSATLTWSPLRQRRSL